MHHATLATHGTEPSEGPNWCCYDFLTIFRIRLDEKINLYLKEAITIIKAINLAKFAVDIVYPEDVIEEGRH